MIKRNILVSLFFITLIFIITGCVHNQKIDEAAKINNNNNSNSNNNMNESEVDYDMEMVTSINIVIDGRNYKATLEDNETAQAFAKLLPKNFNMSELNGNEKYIYMNQSLPTNSSNPKQIVSGDIMLYDNNCLVIFYKSFNTSYSYTRIGHIDNLPDLGDGDIIVRFER